MTKEEFELMNKCRKEGLILYTCSICKQFTYGKATSYHAQLHGKQEIYYNPLPNDKTR